MLLCQKKVDCMMFGYNPSERKCRIYSSGFYTIRQGTVDDGWENYVYVDPKCTLNGDFVHVRTSNLCIHLSPATAAFTEAREYCSDRHSKLISLPTTAKANSFDDVLQTTLKIESLYIGLSKVTGQWTWEDGSLLGSEAQWIEGQPLCPTVNCDCVIKFKSGNYKWGDAYCDIVIEFVCEKEL
ncbi:hypothetical protein ACF0H5_023374 [Mactra antiquata]